MISSRLLLWLLSFTVSAHLAAPSAQAYSAGSDPGFTGAPIDATCFSCHNGGTMPGSVTLNGLPAAYRAGTTYSLTATVTSSGSFRRGFQVTAITNSSGSVGNLQTSNSDTQFKTNSFLPSRQYIGQTFSAVSNSSWTFSWTAPNPTMGTVSFYIGGVGSITNDSAGGDTNYNSSYSVIVGVAPTISTQPTNKTVLAGSNVLFVVGASGTPAPGYQWRFNGANIASATLSSYTRSNVQTNDTGSYTVAVTNIIGSVTSSPPAILTVRVAPSISAQPQSLTVTQGGNPTFTVTASGFPTPGYQWRFNGTNIATATLSSYTRSNAQTTNAGNYTVAVTNVAGSVTSSVATLTVNVAPSISAQPQSLTVTQGGNPTFTVAATGVPSPGYQWRFNGTNIAAATLSSYTRSNAQTTNAGSYTVAVTNIIGSITSSVAMLTVNVAPSITTQPTNRIVLAGSNVLFVVVASGTPAPGYQWRFNGANIAAATLSSYTRSNAQTNDVGSYTVAVTNIIGSVTSSVATLTVNFAPFITTQPTNQTVASGSNVTLAVVANGVPSPNYQWRTNGINFTNRTNSTITVTNFQSVNQAGYDVVITNTLGAVTSATAILYLNSPTRFTNLQRQLNVNFSALLIGAANTNYVIEGATLLTNWTPVRTSSSPSGLINFTDTNVVNGGRIYRARRQ